MYCTVVPVQYVFIFYDNHPQTLPPDHHTPCTLSANDDIPKHRPVLNTCCCKRFSEAQKSEKRHRLPPVVTRLRFMSRSLDPSHRSSFIPKPQRQRTVLPDPAIISFSWWIWRSSARYQHEQWSWELRHEYRRWCTIRIKNMMNRRIWKM